MDTIFSSKARIIPTYDKQDIEQCMSKFRLLVLNNINDIKKLKINIINSGKMGHCEKEYIRAFSWKILLSTISTVDKSSLKSWIEETISKRKLIKNLINNNNLNKFKGDPLGCLNTGSNKNTDDWDNYFNQNGIVRLIKTDVERTMSFEKLFQEPYIRKMESTILKLFAKEHKEISYKQGMNEILSVFIYALYPYYVKSPITNYNNDIINKWVKDPIENYKEIYHFFHDENELENDLYYLFENIMVKLGLFKFFDDPSSESKLIPYLVKRINYIISQKLNKQDKELYLYLINKNLDYGMIFQRWLKCLFKREFHIKDCCLIWDNILANEAENPNEALIHVDNILIAMIIYIKNNLLHRDNIGIIQLLSHYPQNIQIYNLLNLSEKIKDNFSIPIMHNNEEKSKEQNKIEDEKQNGENIAQMNTLLFNPNLMTYPEIMNNFQVNQNMMFFQNNSVMSDSFNQSQPKQKMNCEITKNELTSSEDINNNYNNSHSLNINILKELQNLGNKYKNLITIDDKNRLDFLIDSLSKKI